jgi:hypothetical protein
MSRQSIPLVVADLMMEYEDGMTAGITGLTGQETPDLDMPGGHAVDDGVSEAPGTGMRACGAVNCAHNVEGQRCELDQIEINQHGGCSDYEAAADDEVGAAEGDPGEHDLDFGDEDEDGGRYSAIDDISNGVPEQL